MKKSFILLFLTCLVSVSVCAEKGIFIWNRTGYDAQVMLIQSYEHTSGGKYTQIVRAWYTLKPNQKVKVIDGYAGFSSFIFSYNMKKRSNMENVKPKLRFTGPVSAIKVLTLEVPSYCFGTYSNSSYHKDIYNVNKKGIARFSNNVAKGGTNKNWCGTFDVGSVYKRNLQIEIVGYDDVILYAH